MHTLIIMMICVEYNFSETCTKNLFFSDKDFLRATGISWYRATKGTRLDYIKKRLNNLTLYNTEFCYLTMAD